jgi:antitoxin (DNA-binding transcriptional repressor) of toxin-antitoxin stability system
MVLIDTDRMYTVTEAKPRLHALIAEAHQGRSTHLVKGSEVIAHLVPATARIIDEEPLMTSIALAMLNQETDFAATLWRDGKFHGHAGDIIGRFFAWAWRTDKQQFVLYLGRYHELLCAKLQRQFSAADVVGLLDPAMEVSLHRGENATARHYALEHVPNWLYFQLP